MAKTPPKQPTILAYGMEWDRSHFWHPYLIELKAASMAKKMGALDAVYQHQKNFIDSIWSKPSADRQTGNTRCHVDWHDWSTKSLYALTHYNKVAIGGCGGSGKSRMSAPYGIGEFLQDPMNTTVIVVSTSVKAATKRIWGYVRDFFTSAPTYAPDGKTPFFPAKLQDSLHQIVPWDGERVLSERTGIFLVAGEKSKEKESTDKILGFHAENVILILDELPDLPKSLVKTAISNLSQNPNFQLIGLGNPCDYFDAFGEIAEPAVGWKNVNVEMESWKTKNGGIFLHFDSLKSPNIQEGQTLYPYLPTHERIEEAKRNLGENSLLFWRQYRGFWPPIGVEDAIYSQQEIIFYDGNQTEVEWAVNPRSGEYIPMPQTMSQDVPYRPIPMAFLDIGLVNGGDRCIAYFGLYGRTKAGKPCLLFTDFVNIREDITDKINPREVQIVQGYRRECEKRGVLPSCAGYDASGGGIPYGGFFTTLWSKEVVPIQFGGSPSELPVSDTDSTPCKDKYVNMVSEIWFSGKWMLRNGMLKGIGADLIDELCKRKYTTNKGVDMKLQAEPKVEMKARIGKSPDIADAAMGLVSLVRRKFRFDPKHVELHQLGKQSNWTQFVKRNGMRFRNSFTHEHSGMQKCLVDEA